MVFECEPDYIWINPTIHFAVIGNVLMFIVGGLVLVLPDEYRANDVQVTPWMVEWTWLYLLGLVALWSGYWAPWTMEIAKLIRNSETFNKIVRREFRVNMPAAIVVLVTGVAASLGSISLGLFGYSSDSVALTENRNIAQILSIATSFIQLILVVLSIRYFMTPRNRRQGVAIVYVLLIVSIILGLLSGFKSQVVMPIILVGIAYYVVYRRVPIWIIPVALILLTIAYSIIEPFRVLRNTDPNFESNNVFYIAESMRPTRISDEDVPTWNERVAHFTAAQFPIPLWAAGLEYAASSDSLPVNSPRFLEDIFLSPVMAVVPRAMWPTKPEFSHGAWYYEEVLGGAPGTSVSLSGVVYLNFAGGVVAIIIGFFVFGVVQRALFQGFIGYGAGGLIVILVLLSALRGLDIYYAYIIAIVRFLPMALLLQYLLLKRDRIRGV